MVRGVSILKYIGLNKKIVFLLLGIFLVSFFLYKSVLSVPENGLNSKNLENSGQNEFYTSLFQMGWPFAVLVFLIFFIFVFYKQIAKFIGRMKKFSAGEKGIEAEACDEIGATNKQNKKEEQISDDEYIEGSREQEKKNDREPITKDDWEREMFIAAILNKDKEKMDTAYKKMLELGGDNKKDEILYLELSHKLGDTTAISKLKGLLNSRDIMHAVNMAIGYCYEISDDLKNSELFYYQALKLAINDNEKSLAVQNLSVILYKYNKMDEAVNVLSEVLSNVQDDESKVRIYEALADIYDKEKDYENKAFAIDKAVELKPNDSALLFKAGYSYAEGKYDEIALLHYKNAKSINPKDDSVQNNIGVQYDNLQMPIKSIESYKEAEKLGNTLASANLAYRLLNIGFVSEAKELLNSARGKENVHQNVNEALSEIPKKIEKESDIEKEKIREALLLRRFILNFTEAKFIKGNLLRTVSGEWLSEDGVIFKIDVIDNEITANWNISRKLLSYDYEEYFRLNGKIFNDSSVIDIYEKNGTSLVNGEYKKKKRGLLYYSSEYNKIKYMEIGDGANSRLIYTLTKNKG
ncbi:MAG: hypothetical protein WC022_01020 [Parcubacteria group bacterium]